MKFTFEGFNQNQAVLYEMDMVDVGLLRYFIDFKDSGKMHYEIIDNDKFYWLKYSAVISDCPILGISSKDVLRRRLKKLCGKGILKHKTVKKNGTFSYYTTGENYKNLIDKSYRTTQKLDGYDSKVGEGTTQKSEQSINLLKDQSNKYINTESKESELKKIKNPKMQNAVFYWYNIFNERKCTTLRPTDSNYQRTREAIEHGFTCEQIRIAAEFYWSDDVCKIFPVWDESKGCRNQENYNSFIANVSLIWGEFLSYAKRNGLSINSELERAKKELEV